MQKIYFISGVSGIGKTSTLKQLKKVLNTNTYDVRDLDERGVPDGGGFEWLNKETRYWLDIAKENALKGKSTIICGFANPELFEQVYNKETDIPAEIILLTGSAETIRIRLEGRHTTLESIKEIERAAGTSLDKFIKNNVSFSPELRDIFEKRNLPIIETNNKNSQEVTQEVIQIINSNNAREGSL